MGDSMQQIPTTAASDLGRRQFLRKAAVAGTVAWAVPTIITMEPAGAAELTSPPPEPPVDVGGVVVPSDPPTAAPPVTQVAGTQVAGRTELARTGVELDNLVVAGLAATAGGAALLLWSADPEK